MAINPWAHFNMPLPILQPPPNTPLLPDPDRDSIWKRWFFQLWRLVKDGALGGTVTSVNVSGGTTGLTTSGGPITTSGTITIAGTLDTANGGTGLTAAGTAGNVLTSDGTDWISAPPTGGGSYPRWYIDADTTVPEYECYTVIQQLEIVSGFTFELEANARAAIL
jgi:hypothetical protein